MPQLQVFLAQLRSGRYNPIPGRKPTRVLMLRNQGLRDLDLLLLADALRYYPTGIVEIDASNDPDAVNPNLFTHAKISGVKQLSILQLSYTGVTHITIEGAPDFKMLVANYCNVADVKLIGTKQPRHFVLKENGIELITDALTFATLDSEVFKKYMHFALVKYKTIQWQHDLTTACLVYAALLRAQNTYNTEVNKEMPEIHRVPEEALHLISLHKSGLKDSLHLELELIIKDLYNKFPSYIKEIIEAAVAIEREFFNKAIKSIATNPTVTRKKLMLFTPAIATESQDREKRVGTVSSGGGVLVRDTRDSTLKASPNLLKSSLV